MSPEVSGKICELITLSSLCEPSCAKSFFLEGSGKWTSIPKKCRSLRPEERILEAELKLEQPMLIQGIDIGNYWSAFISVSGSKGLEEPLPLLSSKILLSRQNSVTGMGQSGEGVIFFNASSFSEKHHVWMDRIQVKVSQPYNIPSDRFGLSMFVLRGVIHSKTKIQKRDLGISIKEGNKNSIDGLIAKAEKHVVPTIKKKKYLREFMPSVVQSESKDWSSRLQTFLSSISSPSNRHRNLLNQFLTQHPDIVLTQNQKIRAESQINEYVSSRRAPLCPSEVHNLMDIPQIKSFPNTEMDLQKSIRKVLKNSPSDSSYTQLLQRFRERNPQLRLSKKDEERVRQEFIKYGSSPKRKKRSDSVEILPTIKKSKPSEDFDPSLLREFSKEELKHNQVLVQTRIYKKDKELPLQNDGVIFVEKGVPVTFYKMGPSIYMEIESQFYRPEVKREHVSSIFKDYTEDEINMDKENRETTPVVTIKDNIHICPVCTEAEFFSVRELEAHCWNCTGSDNGNEEIQALLSELNEPTPGPSGLQKIS